jgi:hypothetical protein
MGIEYCVVRLRNCAFGQWLDRHPNDQSSVGYFPFVPFVHSVSRWVSNPIERESIFTPLLLQLRDCRVRLGQLSFKTNKALDINLIRG